MVYINFSNLHLGFCLYVVKLFLKRYLIYYTCDLHCTCAKCVIINFYGNLYTGSLESLSTNAKELDFSTGQCVTGFVYKVESEWAWLTISRQVKAKLFILDSACDPSELQEFQRRFEVGKPVTGYILSFNKEKKFLRLLLHPLDFLQTEKVAKDNISNNNFYSHIREGAIVGGKISKILPGVSGLMVQIGPHIFGRVHFCELKDEWVSDPLSGYSEGQFVKCKVLEISQAASGTVHVDLSFRLSSCGPRNHDSAQPFNNV